MPTPSGSTSILHFPYLLETDIPDVATASQVLAEAIETAIIAVSNTPFQFGASYAAPGPILVQSGSNNYLPPFFVPVLAGQVIQLVSITTATRTGSCVFKVTRNGATVSGLGGVGAGTTPATTNATTPPTVANNDEIALVITSVSGSPDGLSATITLQIVP